MLGDNIDIKVVKAILICTLLTIAAIVISFFRLITGSYIMGFFLFVLILWIAIWKIGIMIMYPGSSAYFTSDIQARVSSQIIKNIHHFGHCLQFTGQCLAQRKIQFQHSQLKLRDKILGSIHGMIQMLGMFQPTLSNRKTRLIDIYREMLAQIQYKHQNHPPSIQSDQIQSISDFLTHPKKIRQMQDGEKFQFLKQRMKQILELNKSLQQIAQTYVLPANFFQLWKFRFFGQKLYEVRFGFQNWNKVFEYQVHLINNYGYVLETAVIRRTRQQQQYNQNFDNSQELSNQNMNQNMSQGRTQNTFTVFGGQNSRTQNRTVLFCNPNGVYIQFFAVQNSYIKQYLKMGYKVIVWNYRGYGQSTGVPTITKCQSDATKVYNYYTEKGFNIQVVHGYSIGGVAAIGVVHKLQKLIASEQKGNHQNSMSSLGVTHKNNIKMLIVDRSFSSIGNMAVQFGPTLHKIAKIVFFLDNKDLSQQFMELATYKMIIWDDRDEIIPDSSSLKGGIFMNLLNIKKQSTCRKYIKDDQEHSLNEEKSSEEIQHQISQKTIQNFQQSIKVILSYSCQLQNDKSLNANHIYEPSAEYDKKKQIQIVEHLSVAGNDHETHVNSNNNIVQEKIKQFFEYFKQIDGGGLIFANSVEKLKKSMQKNQLQFSCKCKSYVMGLAYYGCVHPIHIAFSQHNARKKETIKKIDKFVDKVETIFNLSVQKISVAQQMQLQKKIYEEDLLHAIQTILQVFKSIKCFILNNQNHPSQQASTKKLGRLIAVNNGHNASLNEPQLRLFLKHIKQICASELIPSSSSFLSQNNQGRSSQSFMMKQANSQSVNEAKKVIQFFD